MSETGNRSPLEELVFQSVRFADWAAGEGICPLASEGVEEPADFLFAYSRASGDEEWETMADRISSYVSDLESRLEKAEAERDGWQPIETAPKDGTTLLLGHSVTVFDGWWSEGDGAWIDGENNMFGDHIGYEPTHWRPLPSPPTPPQGDEA